MFETAPLAPIPIGAPERDQPVGLLAVLGGGAVQAARELVGRVPGREHANVVSTRQELLGERLDVPVHAPLVGPGVGRDEGYAHRVRVPAASARRTVRVLAPAAAYRE